MISASVRRTGHTPFPNHANRWPVRRTLTPSFTYHSPATPDPTLPAASPAIPART
ncbi:MAG: hypothetical protein IAE81_02525 [Caldilineaceae bacterium]|nr:hypothetical protein [Caldilineaceae bacterium]